MPRRAALPLIPIAILAACTRSPEPFGEKLRSERIARLAQIAEGIGLPGETLRLDGIGELHVRPPEDARYESVDCLLTALKKSDVPLKTGLVGNEIYKTGNQP